MNEEMKRLYWSCRRGMLELDLLLIPFLQKHYEDLSHEDKSLFKALLEYPDPVIYQWLLGNDLPEDISLKNLLEKIRRNAP